MFELKFTFLLACIVLLMDLGQGRPQKESACQPFTSDVCQNISYNQTHLPNLMGHLSTDAANAQIHTYLPLVKVRCSSQLVNFLCGVFFPPCTIADVMILPCRRVCEKARDDCKPLLDRFGYPWPEIFSCEKFQESGLCIEPTEEQQSTATGVLGGNPLGQSGGKTKEKSNDIDKFVAYTTPPTTSINQVIEQASNTESKLLQSSLLEWLRSGTKLHLVQAELAAEQILMTKLARKKLAVEYGQLKRSTSGLKKKQGRKQSKSKSKRKASRVKY